MKENKLFLTIGLILLSCIQLRCIDKTNKNSTSSKNSLTICECYDDTSLLYFALNLDEGGNYSNNKVNQGIPYYDKFTPEKFIITKNTRHKGDTAFISFRIYGKNNESILCLEPFELITGFKIHNNNYRPLFGFCNVKIDMSEKEFLGILINKKNILKRYCDSLEKISSRVQ